MEKEHEKQQRARSDKQMEVTRAANIENLVSTESSSHNLSTAPTLCITELF